MQGSRLGQDSVQAGNPCMRVCVCARGRQQENDLKGR